MSASGAFWGKGFAQTQNTRSGAPMTCKILWDDSVDAYRVATPYNPEFVELLKQLIPGPARVWDKVAKIWTVTEPYVNAVKDLIEKIYGKQNVTFVSKQHAAQIAAQRVAAAAAYQAQAASGASSNYQYVPPKQPMQSGGSLDTAMLLFCKTLTYEAAKAAYRRAALELHPDKNAGDSSKMTVLNTSWARIEKEFYQR
jgi:hypothetical protein